MAAAWVLLALQTEGRAVSLCQGQGVTGTALDRRRELAEAEWGTQFRLQLVLERQYDQQVQWLWLWLWL